MAYFFTIDRQGDKDIDVIDHVVLRQNSWGVGFPGCQIHTGVDLQQKVSGMVQQPYKEGFRVMVDE